MHDARTGRFAKAPEAPSPGGEPTTVNVVALQERVQELEREREALERFAAMAAHELMEPLVTAEAHATLLAEALGDELEGGMRADLEYLLRGASRMRLIVETLLHDARSSSRPLRRVPVHLERVASESIEILRHEIRTHRATVSVGRLPVVSGDPVLLAGVLKNLMLNALRYGPGEGGEVGVEARRVTGAWCILVTSEGDTIPTEDRGRIFDPFRRGPGERRYQGSGLGLAICRSIVERHGGEIGVRPRRPRGNRFYFTIPHPSAQDRSSLKPSKSLGELDGLAP